MSKFSKFIPMAIIIMLGLCFYVIKSGGEFSFGISSPFPVKNPALVQLHPQQAFEYYHIEELDRESYFPKLYFDSLDHNQDSIRCALFTQVNDKDTPLLKHGADRVIEIQFKAMEQYNRGNIRVELWGDSAVVLLNEEVKVTSNKKVDWWIQLENMLATSHFTQINPMGIVMIKDCEDIFKIEYKSDQHYLYFFTMCLEKEPYLQEKYQIAKLLDQVLLWEQESSN